MRITRRAVHMGMVMLAGMTLLLYVGSYAYISRTGASKLRACGMTGFYYYTGDPMVLFRSDRHKAVHKWLSYFYYPVWWVDHNVLGGEEYQRNMPLLEMGQQRG